MNESTKGDFVIETLFEVFGTSERTERLCKSPHKMHAIDLQNKWMQNFMRGKGFFSHQVRVCYS